MDTFERRTLRDIARVSTPELTISRVSVDEMSVIWDMNRAIFGEERIINTFDRADLTMFLARFNGLPAGFKVGYRENRFAFYSAKGGVMPEYRRRGIARALLQHLTGYAMSAGYARLAFDTFPNLHPGMTVLALDEGFRLTRADYNSAYREYRLRFEKKLLEQAQGSVNRP
jgi:ribosomal protein S18 acetylase RimI-like enzyme